MADTVITPARDVDSGANAMGWAVAVILLLGLILFGIFVWPGVGNNVVPSTPTSPSQGIDVNVKLPEGTIPTTQTGGGGTQNSGTNQQGGVQTQ